jgi:hypothetical protein
LKPLNTRTPGGSGARLRASYPAAFDGAAGVEGADAGFEPDDFESDDFDSDGLESDDFDSDDDEPDEPDDEPELSDVFEDARESLR